MSAPRPGAPEVIARRALCALPLLAAACATTQDTTPLPPLVVGYGHLTPLRLNVSEIEIAPAPAGALSRVDAPSPLNPPMEVARMGRERLFADGTTNKARFVVEQASLVRETLGQSGMFTTAPARFTCILRCRVEILGEDGRRAAFSSAEVRRVFTLGDPSVSGAVARAAEQVVRQAMEDLNVELEFQTRRALRDWLRSAPTTPRAQDVQRETLEPGGSAPAAPSAPAPVPVPLGTQNLGTIAI